MGHILPLLVAPLVASRLVKINYIMDASQPITVLTYCLCWCTHKNYNFTEDIVRRSMLITAIGCGQYVKNIRRRQTDQVSRVNVTLPISCSKWQMTSQICKDKKFRIIRSTICQVNAWMHTKILPTHSPNQLIRIWTLTLCRFTVLPGEEFRWT